MAELTIAIPYKPMHRNTAAALGILWLTVEIATLAYFFTTPWLTWWMKTMAFFGGAALFTYPPFVVASFYLEGSTLVANSDGLVLPPSLWGLGATHSVHWKDVQWVDINDEPGMLLLGRHGGSVIKMDLKLIPAQDLERLLLAMELWHPGLNWSDRAITHRDGMQITAGANTEGTFTQIWENELRRRYNATTFVPLEPGTKLTQGLTITRQMAFGGFSAVYEAENESHEKVVVKELVVRNVSAEQRDKAIELFTREANILAKLNHPQIARVYDHFVKDGNTYMVIEFIDGDTVRDLVRRKGPIPEDHVLDFALQMAGILAYLHGLTPPVLHRDFTPENLVIAASGKVSLIDFGAANEFTSAATGTLVGKQNYMPIEQIRGKADQRSDLYALGCVLSWMLTGQEPEWLSVSHPRTLVPTVSPEMDAIVAKLMAPEAKDRFGSAQELLSSLQQLSTTIRVSHNA